MPKYIVKLKDEKFNKDYYLEWSTIVDAPTTYGCSLDEFKDYYKSRYGEEGISQLDDRLKRVEETGTSGHPPFDDLKDLLSCNRAGEDETEIDLEGILERYCRNQLG